MSPIDHSEQLHKRYAQEIAKAATPLSFGATAFAVAALLAPAHGSEAFYVACAGIIPLLLIGLALEANAFRMPSATPLLPDVAWAQTILEPLNAEMEDIDRKLEEWKDLPSSEVESLTPAELESMCTRLAQINHAFLSVNHRLDSERTARRVASWWYVVRVLQVTTSSAVLLAGEIEALDTLAGSSFGHADPAIPFGAVVFGFVAVTFAALRTRL